MAEMLQPALVLVVSAMAPAPAAGRLSLPNYAQRSEPGTVIIRAAMPAAGSSAQSRACYGPPADPWGELVVVCLPECPHLPGQGNQVSAEAIGAFLDSLGETSAA